MIGIVTSDSQKSAFRSARPRPRPLGIKYRKHESSSGDRAASDGPTAHALVRWSLLVSPTHLSEKLAHIILYSDVSLGEYWDDRHAGTHGHIYQPRRKEKVLSVLSQLYIMYYV